MQCVMQIMHQSSKKKTVGLRVLQKHTDFEYGGLDFPPSANGRRSRVLLSWHALGVQRAGWALCTGLEAGCENYLQLGRNLVDFWNCWIA